MPGAWRKNKRLLQNLHILLRLFQFCSQSFILGEQIRFTAAADGILQSGSLLFCRPRQPQSVSFLVPCRRAASAPPISFASFSASCRFSVSLRPMLSFP